MFNGVYSGQPEADFMLINKGRKMSEIKFSTKQRGDIVAELQNYFENELEIELGQFDADFLLDFISKKLGPVFYNQGVRDAQKLIENKVLDISDELYQIEKESEL